MLQLDALLQLFSLLDSETMSELRTPHRIQRILLDPDRRLLFEPAATPIEADGQAEVAATQTAPLEELVFRLHRASETLRCANVELRGVVTKPFIPSADKTADKLALDLEQFVAHGDQPVTFQVRLTLPFPTRSRVRRITKDLPIYKWLYHSHSNSPFTRESGKMIHQLLCKGIKILELA